MIIVLGMITPTDLLVFLILYALVTFFAIYFAVKNEKNLIFFVWLMVILFIPFLGSTIYLMKHFVSHKSKQRFV